METKRIHPRKKKWPIVLGAALCVLALVFCAVLQYAGYLTYLDGGMASELILANRQAKTHSLFQMDWLYSTEVHLLQTNVLYALGFFLTESWQMARIIGNMIGIVLCMGAIVFLCRTLKLSWARALGAAALFPMTAGPIYANTVTVSGHYLFIIGFGFLGTALWFRAVNIRGKKRVLGMTVLFAAFCMLEGFLSVRYVLCFLCPMLAAALMEFLLAPDQSRTLDDHSMRFGLITALGFFACLAGYAASEILLPRLFVSGVGGASSFSFNLLDGEAMLAMLLTVLTDFLKLLGWRGGVPLFSAEGIVNVSIAGVLFLGSIMTARVFKNLDTRDKAQRTQKRLMIYAGYAFVINLFCYLFIKGTYLNRYLVLAVIFLSPTAAVIVRREKSARLQALFLLMLCVQVGGSSMIMQRETWAQKPGAEARRTDMMEAAEFLQDEGYTHGYGTFWNVRVMQELTEGKLTFTGVWVQPTEEGAAADRTLEPMRWLEPDCYSDLDVCPEKTFLFVTKEEEKELDSFLKMTGAPKIYANGTYSAYGFASSEALVSSVLFSKMKLEQAAFADGVFTMKAGARMRVPTSWREAGSYGLRFSCTGKPAENSTVKVFTTGNFDQLAVKHLEEGENVLWFELPHDDKYCVILFESGDASGLGLENLKLEKVK